MRKLLMCLLLIMTVVGVAQARVVWWDKEKAPAQTSIVLGIGSASCGPGDGGGFGVIAGAWYEKPIVKSFRVGVGFQYASYNSTYTEDMSLMGHKIERKDKFNVGYFQVPVLAKYSLYFSPKVRLNYGIGFYYGIGAFGSLSTEIDGDAGISGGGDLKLWDVLSRTDFGLIVDVSVTIKDKFNIGIDIRQSLDDVSKGGDGDWYNQMINFKVGYIF